MIAGVNMYGGSEDYSYYPARCFWHTVSRKFYWNTHAVGKHATGKQTAQTYGTLTAFTPPTTFTTAIGNIAGLY